MQPEDIDAFFAGAPTRPWTGSAWRYHRRRYDLADATGSLRASGRYHRGRDRYPQADCFPALYLALDSLVCACELVRTFLDRLTSADPLEVRAQIERMETDVYRFTRFDVELVRVLDLRGPVAALTDLAPTLTGADVELTRSLASAARDSGIEALIDPSATLIGDNLILFPDILSADSRFLPIERFDPVLLRNWT